MVGVRWVPAGRRCSRTDRPSGRAACRRRRRAGGACRAVPQQWCVASVCSQRLWSGREPTGTPRRPRGGLTRCLSAPGTRWCEWWGWTPAPVQVWPRDRLAPASLARVVGLFRAAVCRRRRSRSRRRPPTGRVPGTACWCGGQQPCLLRHALLGRRDVQVVLALPGPDCLSSRLVFWWDPAGTGHRRVRACGGFGAGLTGSDSPVRRRRLRRRCDVGGGQFVLVEILVLAGFGKRVAVVPVDGGGDQVGHFRLVRPFPIVVG